MILYLLRQNSTNKYYIGITSNIERRLSEHNLNTCHYTGKQGNNWILVGYKDLTETEARKEEKRLKKAKNKKYIDWYFSSA
jgi:putative endonuclease